MRKAALGVGLGRGGGRAAPTKFCFAVTDVRVVVHGDDVISAAMEVEWKKMQMIVPEWLEKRREQENTNKVQLSHEIARLAVIHDP